MRSGDGTAGPTLSDLLHGMAQQAGRERISVRDLIDALGDRALGALLFLFAVPNVLPMPPGTSAVLGAPLVFLAAQLMVGRGPWLPRLLASRSMSQADFATLVRRIAPWLKRGERMLRPRLGWLARPPMEFAIGAVCLVLALVLVLPDSAGQRAAGSGHQPAGTGHRRTRRPVGAGRPGRGAGLGRRGLGRDLCRCQGGDAAGRATTIGAGAAPTAARRRCRLRRRRQEPRRHGHRAGRLHRHA